MTPASPSDPSLRKAASTCIPIFTVAGSTSMICDVSRQPSAISTIARTYGFIISYAEGASWITENDTTVPFPLQLHPLHLPETPSPALGAHGPCGKSRVPDNLLYHQGGDSGPRLPQFGRELSSPLKKRQVG